MYREEALEKEKHYNRDRREKTSSDFSGCRFNI
jgi:hypothetical protein